MREKINNKRYGRTRRRTILCLVLFVIITACFTYMGEVRAENKSGTDYDDLSVDPTGMGEGYAAVLYDSTNGLPTSEANAIAETKEGFIWIGSYSGLIRYDGNEFYRYDSSTGITSVVSLYVDSRDRLWIGTNDNGVGVMENGEITMLPDSILESSSIRSMAEDDSGKIYIATTHGMGIVDTDMNLQKINASQINDQYIAELRKGDDNKIYGITQKGAVFVMVDGKIKKFYDGAALDTGAIKTALPDPDNPGYIYIGNTKSEVFYGSESDNFSHLEVYDVSPLTQINSIEKFGDTIWVCAENGIGLISDGKFIKINDVPMVNSVDSLIADYQGNLWFTSSRQGVMKIVTNRFTDISERRHLDSMVINSTCMTDITLLLGTDNGLVSLSNTSGDQKLKISTNNIEANGSAGEAAKSAKNMVDLFENIRIRSIIKDSQNRLWFSTYSDLGLVVYDDGTVYNYCFIKGLPSNRVRAVYEQSDGSMLVATSGGLAVISDGRVAKTYNAVSGISNTEILTVCEGDDGKIYAGSDGDGIYIIDDGAVSSLTSDDGLSSEVILRIKKDIKRDMYWIITSNSIAYMKNEKITTIENFPYSNNFDMYEDEDGDMWVLSSNGIYVVSADEMLKDDEGLKYVFYDSECGLPCVATANSYSYKDADGTLYVAGSNGVFSVNVNDNYEKLSDIKMAVPYVDVDGKLIYADEDNKITLPANAHRVTIYGYVFNYSLMNPDVTYELKGFDSEPITVSRRDFEPVVITNLPGGHYIFEIIVSSPLSQDTIIIQTKIEKEMAIYENMWFKIMIGVIAALLIAGIVALYFRKKTKALEKKTAENKIFIREMIEAFAKVIDAKDEYTNGHSTRVAEYTQMLAREMGLSDDEVDKYYNIALLHDIGKVSIPIDILNKPGKLTDQEFNIIKSHSAQGYKILKDISIMPELAIGAGYHHERPDGKGYPRGVKGEDIPKVAQIIAVADTFDAMYSNRPYRKRMNFDKVVSIIKEVSGTQLDPTVVDAFLRLVDKGEFKAPDDDGGGSTESIDNIHKKFSEK